MEAMATITFSVPGTSDEGVAIVSSDGPNVRLALSLKSNGDVDVSMAVPDCARLVFALERAMGPESPDTEDDITAIESLPPFRTFACGNCGAPIRVHALQTYATCSSCCTEHKCRSFGGIGTEIQDVIDAVLRWAQISAEEVLRRHSQAKADCGSC
jgi:hypothetical protein